jgi:formylglycine-generating enzyme
VRLNSVSFQIFLACAAILANLPTSVCYAQASDRVRLASFMIDRTEVSIGQFRAFARASKLTTMAEREGGGFEFSGGWTRHPGWSYERPQGKIGPDNEPAVHLTWHEAEAYCHYVGGRLPTITEWRSAAYTEQRDSPPDGFTKGRTYGYPVGDQAEGMNNNRSYHVAVGTTKRGVNGLYDMGANVWEWMADRRGEDALTAGGSWWYGPEQTRSEGVQWKAANFYVVYIGLRCAYNLPTN